jgi:hypothetical protein
MTRDAPAAQTAVSRSPSDGSGMIHETTIYLPEDLVRESRDGARRDGKAQAQIIRDTLRAHLKDHASRPDISPPAASD